MDRAILKELGFRSRNEALAFLKKYGDRRRRNVQYAAVNWNCCIKRRKRIIVIGSVRIVIKLIKPFTYWMKLMSRCQINNFQFGEATFHRKRMNTKSSRRKSLS